MCQQQPFTVFEIFHSFGKVGCLTCPIGVVTLLFGLKNGISVSSLVWTAGEKPIVYLNLSSIKFHEKLCSVADIL